MSLIRRHTGRRAAWMLFHGSREPFTEPLRPGAFLSSHRQNAIDYAHYGPNQGEWRDPQPGWLHTFEPTRPLDVHTFRSFRAAADALGTSVSSRALVPAILTLDVDAVRVAPHPHMADEWVVVKPGAFRRVQVERVEP